MELNLDEIAEERKTIEKGMLSKQVWVHLNSTCLFDYTNLVSKMWVPKHPQCYRIRLHKYLSLAHLVIQISPNLVKAI